MTYVPHTDAEKREMLARIGVQKIEDLFEAVPAAYRFPDIELPKPLSEPEMMAELRAMSERNDNVQDLVCFLGAGAYHHYIPSVVNHVISRSEFYTAYTPYQPEMSQGTLQAIFEFQTMICELTGLDVANASLYDGATALAEAILMACDTTGRAEVLLPAALHPAWRRVVATYTDGLGIRLATVPWRDGITPPAEVEQRITRETACLVIQQPNFLGSIEDVAALATIAQAAGAAVVVAANPIALGLLAPPGEQGADI